MNLVINDFSLSGQYQSIDDFCNNLGKSFLPTIKLLDELGMVLFKKSNFFECMVTERMKLVDVIRVQGNPSITRFKSLISKIHSCEPFWDSDYKSDCNSTYVCEWTNEVPNCFTEAYEREADMISFYHSNFMSDKIKLSKNDMNFEICNYIDYMQFLQAAYKKAFIDELSYIEKAFSSSEVEFFGSSEEKKLSEFFESGGLSDKDKSIIVDDLIKLINCHKNRVDPGRLSKPLDSYIHEFRTSLDSNREVRILYFIDGSKLVFVFGFIKKDRKTPSRFIDNANNCRRIYFDGR
jgi:phage-related protein